MKYSYIVLYFLIFVFSVGCSEPEKVLSDAEIHLQKIRTKEDSIADWQNLIKQINKADAGYSLQIMKKCHEVFLDNPPGNYANFRKLDKKDRDLIIRCIHHGSPDYVP